MIFLHPRYSVCLRIIMYRVGKYPLGNFYITKIFKLKNNDNNNNQKMTSILEPHGPDRQSKPEMSPSPAPWD